ncbi:MAG: type IV pilus assembly protein PilM [Oligoflexales bacterium]
MIFTQSVLAIDIGSSSVKIARIDRQRVSLIDHEVLPEECVVDGILQNGDVLYETLNDLLSRNGIGKYQRFLTRVGLSLGGTAVLMKKIDLAVSEGDIDTTVYYEAEQQLQHPLEELYVSYHLQERQENDYAYPIIVAGARREVVDDYVELLHRLDLKIGVIDCDSFCISNMFEANYGAQPGSIVLMNVGASSVQLNLIEEGFWVNSSEIPLGGHYYSRTLAGRLGVEASEAEAIKIACSSSSGGTTEAMAVLQEVNQQLLEEMRRTLEFFGVQVLQSIFLSGGSSRILGLANTLSSGLGTTVNLLNPFLNIELPNRFESKLKDSHLYANVIGLGLRSYERRF